MPILVAIAAGLALTAAFPPLGWWWLAIPAVATFQWALLASRRPLVGAVAGAAFALAFVGSLVPWLANLADVAWFGFALVHVPHFALFGWAVARTRASTSRWLVLVGGWVAIFFVLRWQPVFAVEWADPGYVVAPLAVARAGAALWGATGWGVLIGGVGACLAVAATDRALRSALVGVAVLSAALVTGLVVDHRPTGRAFEVAVVQGHPDCPGPRCTAGREQITANHLRLTAGLDPGADLVVWAESSTGFTTDPAQNPAVQDAIVEQVGRLDAHLIAGADRPAGDVNFVNANLLFDPQGRIVGEYRKQHGVPFGEFVPWRAVFGRLPILAQVPRDMLSGDGPVVFDVGGVPVGSVISFETAFGRYAREHAALGAQLLVVATNQSSYGRGAAADQVIGMSTMRAAELGLDVVHAAITGRSTLITGGVAGPPTAVFEEAVLLGTVRLRDAPPTPYARFGDWLASLVLVVAGAVAVQRGVAVLSTGVTSVEDDPVDA